MITATCGHEVVHGISTTVVGPFKDEQVYGTYCAGCIMAYAEADELCDPELVKLIGQIKLAEHVGDRNSARADQLHGMITSKNERIRFLENKINWLVQECKKELTEKDKRIAHLETEITRVFDPVRKFWNEREKD